MISILRHAIYILYYVRVATDLEKQENQEKSGKLILVMENREKSGENVKKVWNFEICSQFP